VLGLDPFKEVGVFGDALNVDALAVKFQVKVRVRVRVRVETCSR
jgi:hypothetical protein